MTAPLHDRPRLDHLVVMADTLAQGAAWCEATLGVAAAPGGEHPLFGTHNRLLTIESPAFPLAYLEIIAINPEATGDRQTGAAGLKRWFDMDDAALREQVRAHGPRLIHWVSPSAHADPASTRPSALLARMVLIPCIFFPFGPQPSARFPAARSGARPMRQRCCTRAEAPFPRRLAVAHFWPFGLSHLQKIGCSTLGQ